MRFDLISLPALFARLAGATAALAVLSLAAGCVGEAEPGEGTGQSALEGDDPVCQESASDVCEISESWSQQGVFGQRTCFVVDGEAQWGPCEMGAMSTPLVLVFGDQPVELTAGMSGSFDLTGKSMSVATDWPTAATPWLAIDRNGNGAIDDGTELFGSASPLASGKAAMNGFVALRELDSNADGRITAADEAWPRLLIWADANGDRASSPAELGAVSASSLTAIDLAYSIDRRCDARGNCEVERARFEHTEDGRTRTGSVVDVHLLFQ